MRFSKEKDDSSSRSQSYFIFGVILVLSQDPAVCSNYREKDSEVVLGECSSQEGGPFVVDRNTHPLQHEGVYLKN